MNYKQQFNSDGDEISDAKIKSWSQYILLWVDILKNVFQCYFVSLYSAGGVWLVTSRLETGNSWTFFYSVVLLS